MVWDGLRPDFVTEQYTPNLYRLAAAGVRFTESHAVFPTVTRANSSSIATGCLPARHGMPSNQFHAPHLVPGGAFNAGDHTHLETLRAERGGRVLLCPALAEYVAKAGGRTVVVSTGSPGSALLQHPEVRACGDMLLHPAIQIGLELDQVEARLGPMPGKTLPNTNQNAWFTRAITKLILPKLAPDLIHFWHTDPDGTQHAYGLGHPLALRALKDADDNLGTVLDALDRLGLRQETAVIVASDHGFSTFAGTVDLVAELARSGIDAGPGGDVVIAGELVYVQSSDPERVATVAQAMQRIPGVGPLFTGARGAPLVPGTIALAAIGADGPFAPDILFSRDWSDDTNAHGHAGTAWSTSPNGRYTASHGTCSPWDVRNTLIAAGPGFKRGVVSDVPAGNIDIAPTVLHLLGLRPEAEFDGRMLTEALDVGPDPASVPVTREQIVTETESVRQTIQFSTVGATRYLDFGKMERA
jgi:arylsulfatase A-like enzyme